MSQRPTKSFVIASLVGHLAVATLFIVVPTILVPAEHRTAQFWGPVLWVAVPALVRWTYTVGFMALIFRRWRSASGVAGVLPGFGIALSVWMLLSWVSTLVACLISPDGASSRGQIGIQVGLFSLLVLVGVLVNYARESGLADTEAIPESLPTPQQLVVHLRAEEGRFSRLGLPDAEYLTQALRRLRERIEYSLPHVGRIGASPDYARLAAGVKDLCRRLSAVDIEDPAPEHLKRASDEADAFKRQAEALGGLLRR